jgi:hypothetical protein
MSEEKARNVKGMETVTVDELSFNEHYSYLLHVKSLEKVEVLSDPKGESGLPPYSLRFTGHLNILRSVQYLKDLSI